MAGFLDISISLQPSVIMADILSDYSLLSEIIQQKSIEIQTGDKTFFLTSGKISVECPAVII